MASIDNVYGTDIIYDSHNDNGFQVGPNGDYTEMNGIGNLRNWIYHCLITDKGEFKPRPEYGVGILSKVKQKMTANNLRAIQADIISNLLQDSRISAVEVTIQSELVNGNNIVLITVIPTVGGQKIGVPPFTFGS
jgi:phage baseplate assembly protein W